MLCCSMVCEKAFDGAEGNLDRLFEKNRKRFRELQQNNSQNLPPELQRSVYIVRLRRTLCILPNHFFLWTICK